MDIADAVLLLHRLYQDDEAFICRHLADVNADGRLNIVDPISLLSHLFLGGPELVCQ